MKRILLSLGVLTITTFSLSIGISCGNNSTHKTKGIDPTSGLIPSTIDEIDQNTKDINSEKDITNVPTKISDINKDQNKDFSFSKTEDIKAINGLILPDDKKSEYINRINLVIEGEKDAISKMNKIVEEAMTEAGVNLQD